jgi:ABC-2 type transport system permease protein
VAGINAIPSTREQIALVARLRWQLFRNSLRTLKGRLEALSTAFIGLAMTGLVFGGGALLGITTYFLVAHNEWQWLEGLLWIAFLFWQLYPLFAASFGVQFDFANLLRFPLRFRSFFALSLIYGLFDPGAVTSLFWLLCMWVGLVVARPAMILWGLIVLFLFAAMNLLFARMILLWTEKWLARRRTREVLGFIFILVMLSFQFIGPAFNHLQHQHTRIQTSWVVTLLPLAHVLPPGVAGHSLTYALGGNPLSAAVWFLFLAVYGAAFFLLLRARLVAQYRGENLSEARAVALPIRTSRAGTKASSSSWEVPWVSGASGAVFEKEVRYALRSGPMLLNLVIPVILVIFLGITFHQQGRNVTFFARRPDMAFPIAVAYTFLIQMNMVFNSFAFEGPGVQFLFVAPVRFRDVMVGKNLFQGVAAVFEALTVWAAVSWIFAPPPLTIVTATLAGLLYATLSNFAVGNILSVCYPRKLDFGAFQRKKLPGVTMLIGMVTQGVLIGLGAGVFFLTEYFDRLALATPIFLVFAAIAAAAYFFSLTKVDRLAMSHRETLTAELCRAE